jgi:hypothetical protein
VCIIVPIIQSQQVDHILYLGNNLEVKGRQAGRRELKIKVNEQIALLECNNQTSGDK